MKIRYSLIVAILCFGFVTQGLSQTSSVSGKVVDAESGEGLPGVNVVVKGTSTGTATNTDGEFSLTVPSLSETLVFSFIGYQTKEVPINGRTNFNVSLELQTVSAEELVVVGYGTVRKSDLTGSVSSVKAGDLNQGVNTTVDQMMQGKIAGARIVENSGEPGGGLSVSIRGASSINAGTGPLYVIDGLPVDNADAVNNNAEGFVGNRSPRSALSSLNPSDIASIEILKDASATAIYGSRGANGVVLITTKQGNRGSLEVDYSGYAGIQRPANKLDVLSAQEYQTVINDIIDDGGGNPEDRVDNIANGGAGTDWQDEVFNESAFVQSNNLSFSGGNESTRYFVSLNYFDQDGVVKSSAYTRYGGRVNVDQELSEKFNWGINLNATYSRDDFVPNGFGVNENAGALYTAFNWDPTQPVRDENGDFFESPVLTMENPLALVNGEDSNRNTYRYFGTVFGEYSILPELSVKLNLGGDVTNQRRDTYVSRLTQAGRAFGGIATIAEGEQSNYLVEGSINYNKSLNQNNQLAAFAGITTQEFITTRSIQSASGFATDATGTNNIGLGDQETYTQGSAKFGYQLISYIGRVNYSFMDRYLLTATFRADGSSRFGNNNKYGFFPSFALGWKLNEEAFMESVDLLSTLKLRFSWGETGNQSIGNFLSLTTFGPGASAVWDGSQVVGINPSRLANPDIQWETTRQWNVGVDFGVLEERINGSIDYYQKDTFDMLLNLPIPQSTGFNTITTNVGSIKNTGLDFTLNSRNISKRDFQWNTNINFSTLQNEVEDLGGIDQIIQGNGGFISNFFLITPGEPLRSYFGYEVEGVWQEGDDFSITNDNVQPGDLKFVDQNGDGTVNPDDRVILGNSFPDYTISIGNTFNYKNFNVYVFLEGVQGVDMLNNNLVDQYFPVQFRRNKLAEPYLNRWTPENPSNKFPSFVNPLAQGAKGVNSLTVEDASYLRLKTVRLGYNIPTSVLGNALRSANIYVTGENLITWTGYSGIDPAVNANGNANARIDYNTYPLPRTFMAGIELGF